MSQSIPLNPRTLLNAYSVGAFPMASADGKIQWYMADPRGVLPLDKFHVPQTLAQLIKKKPRQGGFEVRLNYDFEAVMRGCMEARTEHTWINDELIAAYAELHRLGFAHSVECYQHNQLAGGLYGVSLGAAFFGESMFHRVTDASKVALVHLVRQLRQRDFELLDTQTVTEHLRRFGCTEIPASDYLIKLKAAIAKPRTFAEAQA
jgi:leucyl/phenylalanyl-tRNA---protein transferase